jgi:hypothetical protein
LTQEGDEVPADWEKDEDDIDMKNHGRGTSDGWEKTAQLNGRKENIYH